MDDESLRLVDCIPVRQRRPTAPRKNISLRPETHARLEKVAKSLNVSMPDAIDTMVAYLTEREVI